MMSDETYVLFDTSLLVGIHTWHDPCEIHRTQLAHTYTMLLCFYCFEGQTVPGSMISKYLTFSYVNELSILN